MKKLLWSAVGLGLSMSILLSSGCAGGGGGYVYDDGSGYYQANGYNYGSWGPTYVVGPVREGDHHDGDRNDAEAHNVHGGAPPPQHDNRGAPPPRPVPSIPSGSHPEHEH